MKITKLALIFIVAIGLVVAVSGCGQNTKSDTTTTAIDSSPEGTWVNGDPKSVYNRLTVKSSGRFKFETVDFTGDVKGGYAGTWSMSGNSVRFEWGSGGADSGSCSGSRTGSDGLIFGGTIFHSGFQSATQTATATTTEYPVDKDFADLIYSESIAQNAEDQDLTLKKLLTEYTWIGTNSSGTILRLECSNPSTSRGKTSIGRITISDTNGNSIFPPIPANLKEDLYTPHPLILKGESWHFSFYISKFDENATEASSMMPVKGLFVNTNFLIMQFSQETFGLMYFSKKSN